MTAWIKRLVRVMPLAFALTALTGCGVFGGKGAKAPELTEREIARGAIHGLAWSVRLGTEACARVVMALDAADDPRAEPLYVTCEQSWEVAKASLNAADHVIDAWDAGTAGKIACLGRRALDALAETMVALRKLDVKIPADIAVTIHDGIQLGSWLARLAPGGGSCPLPTTPKPAPAPASAPAVTL